MKKMNPTIPAVVAKVVSGKPSSVSREPVRPGSLLMKVVNKRPKLTPKEPSGPPPGMGGSSSSKGEIGQDAALHQVASGLPTVIENTTIVLGRKPGLVGGDVDWSGIECLKEVIGIYHRIGFANGQPMFKGEEVGSLSKMSPTNCAYLWFSTTWQHFFLSSLPLCEDWDQMQVYCMVTIDLGEIYCPWDSYACTQIVGWYSHFDWSTLTIFELENKITSLQDDLAKETVVEEEPEVVPIATDSGVDPMWITLSDGQRLPRPPPMPLTPAPAVFPPPPPVLKTGWKPKMVAVVVAVKMGLWDRLSSLVEKYLH